jgi:ATP-dependent helicase HepA
LAEARAAGLRQAAVDAMNHLLTHEVERLEALRRVNDHVRPREIQLARQEQAELAAVLNAGRVRLDAVRMIWQGAPEGLNQ